MIMIEKLRHIDSTRIANIAIGSSPIYSTKSKSLHDFADALQYTYPYSPNHEGHTKLLQLTITMDSGEKYKILVGKGNHSNQNTAWMQFRCNGLSESSLSLCD